MRIRITWCPFLSSLFNLSGISRVLDQFDVDTHIEQFQGSPMCKRISDKETVRWHLVQLSHSALVFSLHSGFKQGASPGTFKLHIQKLIRIIGEGNVPKLDIELLKSYSSSNKYSLKLFFFIDLYWIKLVRLTSDCVRLINGLEGKGSHYRKMKQFTSNACLNLQ